MEKVKIVIERSNDMYSAYAEDLDGIYGNGDTVSEVKESIIKSIELLKKYNNDIPGVLKGEYDLIYKFDTSSFLNFYKGIFTNSALERLTGINQRQLHHYASGLKKPREAQVKKIENALHKLGEELMSIEL